MHQPSFPSQATLENLTCVFYDFNTSGFSDAGVQTLSVEVIEDSTVVRCSSNHLTSFAVLVNVAGVDVS